MILDYDTKLSDAQEILTSEASDYYIDAKAAGDAVAPGARLKVQVNTLFVTGDSATLAIALQSDSDAAFGTATTHFTKTATAASGLTAGTVLIDIQIPYAGIGRYIRLYFTVGTGSFSAGKIDAYVCLDTNRTMDKNL